MDLRISRTQRQQLVDWANDAKPDECCGLLLGGSGIVEQLVLTANTASDKTREFEIDPAALINAEKVARSGGPLIIGYFHSHPNGAVAPSPCDARMAAVDGRRWIIIAGDSITCWRPITLDGGDVGFAQEDLV